jgi:hypothetical protein
MYSEIMAIKAKQEEHNAKLRRKLDIDFTGVDTMVASQLHMTEVRCPLLPPKLHALLSGCGACMPAVQCAGCCIPGCLGACAPGSLQLLLASVGNAGHMCDAMVHSIFKLPLRTSGPCSQLCMGLVQALPHHATILLRLYACMLSSTTS